MSLSYLIGRLAEASTIRGIIMFVAGATGLTVSPDMVQSIVAAGVALSGLIGMFLPDKIPKTNQ